MNEADAGYMRRAIDLAGAGWGRVHPNPLVGAVVVRDGAIVGEGAHREYGGDHAEVEALADAGERARGATLYVTLEPCSHHGKTPPCTTAAERSGISRVVFAVPDPHPDAGGGAKRLEEAGIQVESGIEADRARAQNALFLRPLETGRPFVALKYGMTLDARIARRPGESTRITGSDAEAEVHRLRGGFDAVLVGGETARVDDPRLTVRHGPEPRRPPVRIVIDPRAQLSPESRLARTAGEVPVQVLVNRAAVAEPDAARRVGALRSRGVEVVEVEGGADGLDLPACLDRLYDLGTRTILCEGGGRLGSALLQVGRVDRLYLFTAPNVLGDAAVPAFTGGASFQGRVVDFGRVGADIWTVIDRADV